MCRHSRCTPRKLQHLAFRRIVNSSLHRRNELEYISKIPLIWNYFSRFKFIVTLTSFRGVPGGKRKTCAVKVVQGCDLLNYIKIKRKYNTFLDVNFWCLECISFCDECFHLDETETYKYTNQLADCAKCGNT